MASFSTNVLLRLTAKPGTVCSKADRLWMSSLRLCKPDSHEPKLLHPIFPQQARTKITLPPEAPSGRNPARPFVHERNVVDKKDAPVKFTGSDADQHKVLVELNETIDDSHPYERHVVAGSIAVLLIYFCILRQENHLDKEMRKPLWERIPGLEERTLVGLIEYNKEIGEPTEKYELRLAEVRAGDTKARMAW